MCYAQVAMAGANIGMTLLGNRQQDKQIGSEIAKLNAQKREKVREMNYNIANLSQEQRDQFDQAVTQLQGNSINSIRNQGMIEAALGETGLEGRSMDSVMREVRGQDARVADSIRDSYGKSWTGLQYAKESSVMETQSSLDGMPTIKGPSGFSRALGIVEAGVSGYSTGGKIAQIGKDTGLTSKAGALLSKVGANLGIS